MDTWAVVLLIYLALWRLIVGAAEAVIQGLRDVAVEGTRWAGATS